MTAAQRVVVDSEREEAASWAVVVQMPAEAGVDAAW